MNKMSFLSLQELKNLNPGKLKAIIDRELNYLSKLNFIMIGYLFIKEVGIHWWFLLLIPAYLFWIIIDLKFIFPKELDYVHRKSPVLKELLKK